MVWVYIYCYGMSIYVLFSLLINHDLKIVDNTLFKCKHFMYNDMPMSATECLRFFYYYSVWSRQSWEEIGWLWKVKVNQFSSLHLLLQRLYSSARPEHSATTQNTSRRCDILERCELLYNLCFSIITSWWYCLVMCITFNYRVWHAFCIYQALVWVINASSNGIW